MVKTDSVTTKSVIVSNMMNIFPNSTYRACRNTSPSADNYYYRLLLFIHSPHWVDGRWPRAETRVPKEPGTALNKTTRSVFPQTTQYVVLSFL